MIERINSLDQLTMESILKADSFDQSVIVLDEVTFQSKQLIDRKTFFDEIYVGTNQNKIWVRNGNQIEYSFQDLDKWLADIHKNNNSVVVFISGYAGCGKTVFSQYILKNQLKRVEYDYSYYNYDIGSYYETKERRISNVIRSHFLEEYSKLIRAGEEQTINEFEGLLCDIKSINILNSGSKISRRFLLKGPYSDLKAEYKEAVHQYNAQPSKDTADKLLKSDAKFKCVLTGQLDDFELQEILCLDYLLRIAVYLANPVEESRVIYICYDNMDSIENFDELKIFDNTLTAVRRNIDKYIIQIAPLKFYIRKIRCPKFIIMATYRKITAAKVDINNQAERCEDPTSENKFIYYIDASHNYKYQDIVQSRVDYYVSNVLNTDVDLGDLKKKLERAKDLTKVEFIQKNYAGFWNNNFRTCTNILAEALENHEKEASDCITLYKSRNDGYDNDGLANIGASSVFMGIICKISGEKGIWKADRFNLVELTDDKKSERICDLTSLSRLILTYMSNQIDGTHARPVSMKDLFDQFSDLYGYPNGKSGEEIIDSVTKMLARDETDTWRRPIYYHKNAPDSNNDFQQQWLYYCGKSEKKVSYTELLLCDCGYSYVRRLMSDFEFFSARKMGRKHINLYLATEYDQLVDIINAVNGAVKGCCIKLNAFQEKYMEVKHINLPEYLELKIHPRTRSNISQLHAERIIFSHIHYLDHCRKYHLKYNKRVSKKDINDLFKQSIRDYLSLYHTYIEPKDKRRLDVAIDLTERLKELDQAPQNRWAYISIATTKTKVAKRQSTKNSDGVQK